MTVIFGLDSTCWIATQPRAGLTVNNMESAIGGRDADVLGFGLLLRCFNTLIVGLVGGKNNPVSISMNNKLSVGNTP